MTPKAVYRIVETSFPESRLEVVAPKSMEVFTGTSRRIAVEVRPLYGMSGDVELHLSSTNPQIILQMTSLKLKLSPMCTTKAEIGISIPPESPEGTGSVIVSYKGVNLASTTIALKRPGQQQQQQPPTFQTFLANIQLLAASAVFAFLVVFMVIRYVKGRVSGVGVRGQGRRSSQHGRAIKTTIRRS